MNHGVEVFHFSAKNNKVIEVTSKPYTFELEQVLIERFGIELIKQITENNSVSLDVDLEAVREDFPQLLELKNQQIDWSKQPYDEIARVYYFFLEYKRNVKLRALKSETETLRSKLEELQALLASIQANIYHNKN